MESGEEKYFVSLDTSSTTSSLKFIPKKKKKPSPFKPPPVPPSLFIPNLDQLTDQLVNSHAGLMMMNQLLEQQHQMSQQQPHSLSLSSDQLHVQQPSSLNFHLQSMPQQLMPQRSNHQLQQQALLDDMASLSSGHNELNHLLNPHTNYDINNSYASFNPYVTTTSLFQGSSVQLQPQSMSSGHLFLPKSSSSVCSGRTSPPIVSRRPRPPPPIPSNEVSQAQSGVISPHAEHSNIHHHLYPPSHRLPHPISSHSSKSSTCILFDQSSEQHNLRVNNPTASSSHHHVNNQNLNSSSLRVHAQQQSLNSRRDKKNLMENTSSSSKTVQQNQQQSPQTSACLTNRPKCSFCVSIIVDEECTEAEGGVYHINCFSCTSCRIPLGGLQYIMHPVNGTSSNLSSNQGINLDNNSPGRSYQERSQGDSSSPIKSPYCTSCFDSLFGEYCEGCGELIHVAKGPAITHEGRSWHACHSCFKCYFCSLSLLGLPFLPHSSGFIFCSVKCSQDSLISHNKGKDKKTSSRRLESSLPMTTCEEATSDHETKEEKETPSVSSSHLHLQSNQKQQQLQPQEDIQEDKREEVKEVAVTPKNDTQEDEEGDPDSSSTGEEDSHYHSHSHYLRIQGKNGEEIHDREEVQSDKNAAGINDDGEQVQEEVVKEKEFLPQEEGKQEEQRTRSPPRLRRIDDDQEDRYPLVVNNAIAGNLNIEDGRDSGCHATDSSGSGSVSQEDNPVVKSSPELMSDDHHTVPRLPSQPPPSLSPSSTASSNVVIAVINSQDCDTISETPVSTKKKTISSKSDEIEKVSKSLKCVSFDPETMREKEGPSVVRRLRTTSSRKHRKSSSRRSSHRSSRSSSRRHRHHSRHRGSPDVSSEDSSDCSEDSSSSCSCSSCCSDSSSSSSSEDDFGDHDSSRMRSCRDDITGESSSKSSSKQPQTLSVASLQQQVRSTQQSQQHQHPMIAIKQKKKNALPSFLSIFLPSFPSSSTNSTNSSNS